MEATATVPTTGSSSTGSTTIAGLIPRAAASYETKTAVRFKRDGAWHDVTYPELATIVQEIALGLIDLGIEPGERVCILANTRPEWSYADLAATSAGARGGADLPDQLTRGVPLGDLRLRGLRDRLRERRAAREDRRHPRPAAEPAHGRSSSTRRPASPTAPRRASPHCKRSRSTRSASAGAHALWRSSTRAAPPCAPRTPTRSSTPPAPPALRRAACSPTATTARSST